MKRFVFFWLPVLLILPALIGACQGNHKPDRPETTTAPRRPTDLLEAPHTPPTIKSAKKSRDSTTKAQSVRPRS